MLFFERQKTNRGEWPSILIRDKFPRNVRVQCWQIMSPDEDTCQNVVLKIKHAIGIFKLNEEGHIRGYSSIRYSHVSELQHFFLNGLEKASEIQNVEYAFSVLELLIKEKDYLQDRLLDAINYRLRLGGVGYKILDKTLVPIDDENLTNTATIPAISILNIPDFSSSYAYLHQAYLDYREGSEKSLESAIDNTVKAVESLLKYIFDKVGIKYTERDTYQPLVLKAKENGLFPNVDDDKLAPLMNELKAIGSIRNREGGHGHIGKKATDRLVRLAIHHATANILYIAETYLEEHKNK